MTTPQVKIVNCETGAEIVRDATAQEIAQMNTDAANWVKELEAKAQNQVAKSALLNRLGISEQEAVLLLK